MSTDGISLGARILVIEKISFGSHDSRAVRISFLLMLTNPTRPSPQDSRNLGPALLATHAHISSAAVPSIDKRHVPLRDSEDVPAEVHVAVRGLEVAAEGDGGHGVHDAVVEALQAVPRYVGALYREVTMAENHLPIFWPTGRPDDRVHATMRFRKELTIRSYMMRCHPEEEYEQSFGVLIADKLRGVRVAEVAERYLEEGRPVQVLRHLQVLKPK